MQVNADCTQPWLLDKGIVMSSDEVFVETPINWSAASGKSELHAE